MVGIIVSVIAFAIALKSNPGAKIEDVLGPDTSATIQKDALDIQKKLTDYQVSYLAP